MNPDRDFIGTLPKRRSAQRPGKHLSTGRSRALGHVAGSVAAFPDSKVSVLGFRV